MTTTRTWHCQIILQKSPNVRGNGPANNKSNTYVHVRKTYELIQRHKHVFQFRWTSYVHIWALVQFIAIISDRLYSHSRHSLSRSPRDSEILGDIRTWTYQICKVGEKKNWTITFTEGAISPLFQNILLPVIRFSCLNKDQILLEDKLLFEISEVEITSQLYFAK